MLERKGLRHPGDGLRAEVSSASVAAKGVQPREGTLYLLPE